MAKKHKLLYDRLTDYAKKYQSGIDIVADYNSRFAEVQLELTNYLLSIFGINERSQQYLDPLVVSITIPNVSGFIAKPSDFRDFISASYNGKPVHKVAANQLDTYEQLPQRRGNLIKSRVNIASVDGRWEVRPIDVPSIFMRYIKNIPVSTIAFTYSISADEDIMAYDDVNTVDFVWAEECIPLLVYMMLDKYGISVREEILNQYSQLRLAKEVIK